MDTITNEEVGNALKAMGEAMELLGRIRDVLEPHLKLVEWKCSLGFNKEAVDHISEEARAKYPGGLVWVDRLMSGDGV